MKENYIVINFKEKITDRRGETQIIGRIIHENKEVLVISDKKFPFWVKEKGTFLCKKIPTNSRWGFTMKIGEKKMRVYFIRVIIKLHPQEKNNLKIVSLSGNPEKLSWITELLLKESDIVIVHDKNDNTCGVYSENKDLIKEIEEKLKKRISFVYMDFEEKGVTFPLGKENFIKIKNLCLAGK